jgi:hypothetical protein
MPLTWMSEGLSTFWASPGFTRNIILAFRTRGHGYVPIIANVVILSARLRLASFDRQDEERNR